MLNPALKVVVPDGSFLARFHASAKDRREDRDGIAARGRSIVC